MVRFAKRNHRTIYISCLANFCRVNYDNRYLLVMVTASKLWVVPVYRLPFYLKVFRLTSASITCTYCNKLYIGETGRRLGDRFREHLRDVERNDKDASKPVARHFNLPNHSKQYMAVCGLSLHLGSSESRKTPEQKFIFQIGILNPHGIKRAFFIQLIYSRFLVTLFLPMA